MSALVSTGVERVVVAWLDGPDVDDLAAERQAAVG
jgi:hypothetical protein